MGTFLFGSGGGKSIKFKKIFDNGWGTGINGVIDRGTNYSIGPYNIRLNNARIKITGVPKNSYIFIKFMSQTTGGKTSGNCAWLRIYDETTKGAIEYTATYSVVDTNSDNNGEFTSTRGYMYAYTGNSNLFFEATNGYSLVLSGIYYLPMSDFITD